MGFRCALCNEVQPEGESALVVFLCPEDRENLQKQMKTILKFSKGGKSILKKDNPQKGKGNINLCQDCYDPKFNKRCAQWQSDQDKKIK